MKEMTQEERLNYLVEEFKEDSVRYRDQETPEDTEGKKRILRSLMNIRMPHRMDAGVIEVQDEYLKERILENGIVTLSDIPMIADKGSTHAFADKLSVWQGDITRLAVDAIVNAANSQMLGCFVPMHTCIDNIIGSKAGIRLRLKCHDYMCRQAAAFGKNYQEPTGQAMITPGYNLPCRYILHTVGPIVQGRLTSEHERLLASCYTSCLNLAEENCLESIAFCCISTGVFMFPNQRAAEIAVETVRNWLDETGSGMKVVFNVYKDLDLKIYTELCK